MPFVLFLYMGHNLVKMPTEILKLKKQEMMNDFSLLLFSGY